MSVSCHPIRSVAVLAAAASSLVLVAPTAAGAEGRDRGEHHGNRLAVSQVNLVSDLATVGASVVDPDLVNPWGLALGPTSPLWSANNGTDTATLYSSAAGSTTATKVSAVRVTFPDKPELPTGQVFNGTLTGRIEAWAPGVDPAQGNAETKAIVPGAAYTGLALAVASSGPQLYAANFAQGTVDVFDSTFALQSHSAAAFHDRKLPKGYAPFGIATLHGNVFVAYAKVDPATHRNAVGRGLGFVDEFTPEGRLISRVAARQSLNAPWGLEIAPPSWGELAGDLLVGNFGDGRINVIEHDRHGRFGDEIEGQLRNTSTGKTLVIPGLWALQRGTTTTGGADSIWFSAGIDNEQHGLIGVLRKP
jgi:uncharacterized protein (TIGR03118 family)